jgi:hypothetical protein
VRGKVAALSYDHVGDFDGFVMETAYGTDHFCASRERRVQDLVRRACEERLTVVVFPLRHRLEIRSLLLHERRDAF